MGCSSSLASAPAVDASRSKIEKWYKQSWKLEGDSSETVKGKLQSIKTMSEENLRFEFMQRYHKDEFEKRFGGMIAGSLDIPKLYNSEPNTHNDLDLAIYPSTQTQQHNNRGGNNKKDDIAKVRGRQDKEYTEMMEEQELERVFLEEMAKIKREAEEAEAAQENSPLRLNPSDSFLQRQIEQTRENRLRALGDASGKTGQIVQQAGNIPDQAGIAKQHDPLEKPNNVLESPGFGIHGADEKECQVDESSSQSQSESEAVKPLTAHELREQRLRALGFV